MAASYSTGTATGPTDLLQKLVTWLVAQGWTQNMSQADGTGWRAHLSKSGTYINLRATPGAEGGSVVWAGGVYNPLLGGIGLYVGTGYSGASAWNAQAGGPIGNGAAYTIGSFMQTSNSALTAYHFFDDGADNIVVVVERTSGIFTHMGWGTTLTKAGAWTGGAYFFAPFAGAFGGSTSLAGSASVAADCPFAYQDRQGGTASFVRADVDTFTGKWLSNGTTTIASYGYTGKLAASAFGPGTIPPEIPNYNTFKDRQVSALNSQANLLPIRVFAARGGSGYSLLGDVPSIFLSNGVGNGFNSGSIYSIGAENFMAFPNFMVKKGA